jgi:hypothetical protein
MEWTSVKNKKRLILKHGYLRALRQHSARQLAGNGREVFIWGAGSAGREAAALLRANGIAWTGFIDRDPAKAGAELEGVKIYLPEELKIRPIRPKVLIASMYHREIAKHLRAMGFHARRDFEVFPADGAKLPSLGVTPKFFSVWRENWLVSHRCVRPGTADTPVIRAIGLGARCGTTIRRTRLLRCIPNQDSEWICLYPSRMRVLRFYWRIPPKQRDLAAKVALDPLLPSGFGNSRPFLIRLLGLSAGIAMPVICRARVVRQFLSNKPKGFSLDDLAAWIETLNASMRASVLCEVKLPSPAQTEKRSRCCASDKIEVSPILRSFVRDAAKSGMPVFSANEAANDLPRLAEVIHTELNSARFSARDDRIKGTHLQIVSHERGNFFFAEIRDFLAGVWRRAGAKVVTGDQRSRRLGAPWRSIIVAPHEFDILGDVHASWSSSDDAIVFNTEQPQTRWFSLCLPRLLRSKLVFDINFQSSLLLRALGVNAHFFPLGIDEHAPETRPRPLMPKRPAFEGMSRADRCLPTKATWLQRPIDILFVGTLSPKRADFFAANASIFSKFQCFFHLPPSDRPLIPGTPDSLDSRDMADLCSRSKIVLNLHRDAVPYCEWHRVVFQAMRQGALVVSEPMMDVPGFSAGKHFVTAPAENLASVAAQMLSTAQGRRKASKIAFHAFETLRARFDAKEIAGHMLALL